MAQPFDRQIVDDFFLGGVLTGVLIALGMFSFVLFIMAANDVFQSAMGEYLWILGILGLGYGGFMWKSTRNRIKEW